LKFKNGATIIKLKAALTNSKTECRYFPHMLTACTDRNDLPKEFIDSIIRKGTSQY
jgi:hypothetical protein